MRQNAGKASCFNHSNLGLAGSVLVNVLLLFEGLNAEHMLSVLTHDNARQVWMEACCYACIKHVGPGIC